MSDTSPVSLVCWDVVGAAAIDDSVLERAFAEAIATQGVVTGTAAYVRSMVQFDRTRGWPPADVMRILFPEDEIRAQAANLAFERSFQAALDRFGALPLPGANEALAKLTAAGIKLAGVLGLPGPAMSLIAAALDSVAAWRTGTVRRRCDQGLPLARSGPHGGPAPASAMCGSVAVVTASESGVPTARRAGAGFVGMLSHVDDAGRLRRAGATHLLADIGELPPTCWPRKA